MTAQTVLDELNALGIRIERRPNGNIYVAPKDRLTVALVEKVRTHKSALLSLLASPADERSDSDRAGWRADGKIVEATFRPAADVARLAVQDHQFPPCPKCGASRYWISGNKVLCGSKVCYSALRFILTSIQFHPIN
ncbi:MAG: hypothetical protein WCA22_00685 [Candidatus Binatus sp.]